MLLLIQIKPLDVHAIYVVSVDKRMVLYYFCYVNRKYVKMYFIAMPFAF